MVESAVSKTVQGGFDSRLEHMKKFIKPQFKCYECKKEFSKDQYGPTLCIFCGHIYVDWLNWEECIKSLGKYGRA